MEGGTDLMAFFKRNDGGASKDTDVAWLCYDRGAVKFQFCCFLQEFFLRFLLSSHSDRFVHKILHWNISLKSCHSSLSTQGLPLGDDDELVAAPTIKAVAAAPTISISITQVAPTEGGAVGGISVTVPSVAGVGSNNPTASETEVEDEELSGSTSSKSLQRNQVFLASRMQVRCGVMLFVVLGGSGSGILVTKR